MLRARLLNFIFLSILFTQSSFARTCTHFLNDHIILDFEASALHNGFPTEVAWYKNGGYRSFLIKPPEHWKKNMNWDSAAEDITGISLGMLEAEGVSPQFVIEKMLEDDLFLSFVFSTSGKDSEWLGVLLNESSLEPFKLKHIEELFHVIEYGKEYGILEVLEAQSAAMAKAKKEFGGKEHRALVDVQVLVRMLQIFEEEIRKLPLKK